jgi:hypothetical protein
MGNLGRYVCVAVPFILALASMIALLVAGLAGVADKSLYMFQVNTTNLEISPASITNLISARTPQAVGFHDPSLLDGTAGSDSGSNPGAAADTKTGSSTTGTSGSPKTSNITAADLGLSNLYDIGLWGWCYTSQNGTRTCTKPEFNWAQKELNMTTSNLKTLATKAGQNITLPKEITDAVEAFGTITKWTEVVFIIAVIALGIELIVGLFTSCSRIVSCITYLIAGVATVAVCTFASLATAMAVVVVGAVEASAKFYGVKADMNTKYLATVWIAAAFAIAAGFFWLFTICCCKPDHSSRSSRKRHSDDAGEKLMPVGAYQPIHEDHGYNGGYNNRHSAPQYGYAPQPHAPRRDLAYEPYSHANV